MSDQISIPCRTKCWLQVKLILVYIGPILTLWRVHLKAFEIIFTTVLRVYGCNLSLRKNELIYAEGEIEILHFYFLFLISIQNVVQVTANNRCWKAKYDLAGDSVVCFFWYKWYIFALAFDVMLLNVPCDVMSKKFFLQFTA